MPVDESSLLPEPPPPRPARRDAAIGAAMRRFDGVEEPTVAPKQAARRGFGSRPQFGALVTASLIAVIGIPAAMIAIRNNDLPPPAPTSTAPRQQAPVSADEAAPPPATVDVAAEPAATAAKPPASMLAPNRRSALPDEREAGDLASTPVPTVAPASPMMAAPAPPPPAPPPPAAERDEAYAEADQIAVTGSRIAKPGPMSESIRDGRGRSQSLAQKSNVGSTAPEWVIEDGAYRLFLNQLQSAIRANDRAGVIRLVSFPVRVNRDGRSQTYTSGRALLADYDSIFTAQVRGAILSQRFETLFGRDQGVMIGSGQIWFDHICRNTSCSPPGPVRIKAINP
ncbi:MAG TPA: hypothetical protein VFZ35_03780 [Sphingomicrobium sp.]